MASNYFLGAVLDISRKVTAVKERADYNDRLHCYTQNPPLYSYKIYCRRVLAAHGRSHATVALVGRLTMHYGIIVQIVLTPVAQSAPRNLLTRWDVSSIPANGIFLTKY